MRLLIIFIISLCLTDTFGQITCAIDLVPNSNKIVYNEMIVDSLLEAHRYDAFFLGESHTIDFEPEFKFSFIKHLNSFYGIRDVFMEIGFSASHFFNLYLQTGDTLILKENRLPYLWGQYKSFWNRLYSYNKALPDSSKIRIHGIDFERTEVFKLLTKALNPAVSIPASLQETFLTINKMSSKNNLIISDREFLENLSKVEKAFAANIPAFKTIYGDSFSTIYKALTNRLKVNSSFSSRNKNWLTNTEQIIQEKQIKKFIGLFGSAHTRYNNPSSLTVSLKRSKIFGGSILTIATIYKHFISTGGGNEIAEYGYKEKEVFDKYYNRACRAVIVKSDNVPKTGFKTYSDFVLFAKDIIDR